MVFALLTGTHIDHDDHEMQFQIFICCFLRFVYKVCKVFAPKKGLFLPNSGNAFVIGE